MKKLTLVLGNQLFPLSHFKSLPTDHIFMAEDRGLCTHFKYHKHKILFFLLSMREFKKELIKNNFSLTYIELDEHENIPFIQRLQSHIKDNAIGQLHCFEIEDKFFEEALIILCEKLNIDLVVHQSPMFLVTRDEFRSYLESVKRPFMKTFYERQRKNFKILVDKDNRPTGGQWSYDSENRKKWPNNLTPPPLARSSSKDSSDFHTLAPLVDKIFHDHPGETHLFWLPTTRVEALNWLKAFIEEKLESFGDYQDSLTLQHDFLFHSVLSPFINIGLLTPHEVIDEVLKAFKKRNTPLNCVEGFIRQVLGWREFVRGIYQEFDEIQQQENFWNHQRKLSDIWYSGETGIPPLDSALQKTWRYGHTHHIERLMVLSNVMLLCEIHPQEVYRWFMEMYVDSSDWVMGPNVFGMGQFSDGGIFATKPYICGSNYWMKMGRFPKGEWTQAIDGLYWRFIDKHRDFFAKNPRLSLAVRNLDKMDEKRKKEIFQKAEDFIQKATL